MIKEDFTGSHRQLATDRQRPMPPPAATKAGSSRGGLDSLSGASALRPQGRMAREGEDPNLKGDLKTNGVLPGLQENVFVRIKTSRRRKLRYGEGLLHKMKAKRLAAE